MKSRAILMPVVVSLAVLAGCDNEQNKKSPAPIPTNPPAGSQTPTKAPEQPAVKPPESTTPAVVAPTTQKVVDAAKTTMDATKTAATDAAKAATDATNQQANKLMNDLSSAIGSAKWSDADALIKQLDAMRDKLPADLQTKYDGLKKLYTDNKAKLQAIPGLGK